MANFRSSRASSPRPFNGKTWPELSEEEHQRFPGDYETQTSQGSTAHHSEEHLATSDKGIALLRRFLEKQVKAEHWLGALPAWTEGMELPPARPRAPPQLAPESLRTRLSRKIGLG